MFKKKIYLAAGWFNRIQDLESSELFLDVISKNNWKNNYEKLRNLKDLIQEISDSTNIMNSKAKKKINKSQRQSNIFELKR